MKISIIIPALNEADYIERALLSVIQQDGEFEVIVVDGGSADATVDKAKKHARVIHSQRGRAVQMNAGARAASGDVLLFLHADCQLHPEALPTLARMMQNSESPGGTFMLAFDSRKLLLRFIAFFTRFTFRYFHFGDQGIFVRRAVFDEMGGYREMSIMEDIDFIERLCKRGRLALIKLPTTASPRRFLRNGIIREQLRNIFLVVLYLLGARPERLKQWYEKPLKRQ
jgi:rSAM/selenodomain-associated transferase 2